MKKLVRILFLTSFAALPLFATDEPKPSVSAPADENEATLDVKEVTKEEETKEAEEVVFLAEDKKDEYAGSCGCGKKRDAGDQKDELNFAFAEDKKDEAQDEQKEDSYLA